MGDRTNVQLYIYDCPSTRVAAVLDIINDFQLELDWYEAPADDRITLGAAYGDNQGAGDAPQQIASRLIADAPEVSFDTWSDPAYDWLGAGVMYTPQLGRFDFESDSQGAPQFSSEQIAGALDRGGPEAVRKMIGMQWIAALATMRDSLPRSKNHQPIGEVIAEDPAAEDTD